MIIIIDVKAKWFKKSISEIQVMIYEELYNRNWHLNAAVDLGQQLKQFKLTENKPWKESKGAIEGIVTNSIVSCVEDSLKTKHKGQRVSYQERIYLYKLMKKGEKSLTEISLEYSISLGTLYNIKKEFDVPIPGPKLKRSNTSRNLVESSWIQNLIRNYLNSTKIPLSSKDIWEHINTKTGLVIDKKTWRKIMIETLGMKYKKGQARLTNYDEEFQAWTKQWFSIRLWKVIHNFKMLINVDETSFSRLTKKSFSWIPKGKEQIIKSIWFRNSWSLVTAITSTGGVIAMKRIGSIKSILFIEFLRELIKFIKEDERINPIHWFVMLDNASIHRAEIVQKYMQSENLNIAFIPQYWPELAPIEHYFSKLKQEVTDRERGKDIDWKSEGSNELLRRSMLAIPPRMVRKIWTSFTKEIYKSLDSY